MLDLLNRYIFTGSMLTTVVLCLQLVNPSLPTIHTVRHTDACVRTPLSVAYQLYVKGL